SSASVNTALESLCPTPRPAPSKRLRVVRSVDLGFPRAGGQTGLDHFDMDDNQDNPCGRQADGDPCEDVAGTRAERAAAAGPAEGAGQPSSFTALDQDQEDQDQAQNND